MLTSGTDAGDVCVLTIPKRCHGKQAGKDTLIVAIEQPSEACKAGNAKKKGD